MVPSSDTIWEVPVLLAGLFWGPNGCCSPIAISCVHRGAAEQFRTSEADANHPGCKF